MNKIISIITVIIFIAFLSILLICNFNTFYKNIGELINANNQEQSSTFDRIENSIRAENPFNDISKEIYGIGLRVFNKKMVGNYEFTKLSDNSVIFNSSWTNVDSFTNSVIELNEYLKSKNIPLVYVQTPFIKMTDEEKAFSGNKVSNAVMNEMCDSFRDNNVDVLDLNQNERIQSIDPIYFRSDIHATTLYEYDSAQIILSYLEENYGLNFPEKDKVFDLSQYDISSYPFYGNTTSNTGRFYSLGDTFDIYHPRYHTDMKLYDYSDGTEKSGTYDDVCLNGYESNPYTDRTYWVTNFLRWPSPYYDIYNFENEQSPRLLVICDSIYLRGCSFLSLASNTVTVYDPRYDNGRYLEIALNSHDYDAVIVTGIQFFYTSINIGYSLSDYNADIKAFEINGNDLIVTVLNNSSSEWSENDFIRCCLWINNEDKSIRAFIPNGECILPGEEVVFYFKDVVSEFINSSTVGIQMLQEGITYFGPKVNVSNPGNEITNNAEILSITANYHDSNSIDVTVKNTGSTTWNTANNYRLCLWQNGEDSGIRVDLPSEISVKPGEEHTFTLINLIPPEQATLEFQMLIETVCYFGEKELFDISNASADSTAVNDAQILSTSINHSNGYSIDVTVKNTGSTTWSAANNYRLCLWQNGEDSGIRVDLPSEISVKPGEEYTFTLENFIPSEEQQSTLEFQMLIETVCYFGEKKPVKVASSN